jgi:transcription elongation factor Elf1
LRDGTEAELNEGQVVGIVLEYSKIDPRRFKCYENQAIISFCKPFVKSRSGVQLSCKKCGLRLDTAEKKLKKELIDIRNKITAHSDSEEMHYKGVTIEIGGDSDDRAPFFIFDEGLCLSNDQRRTLETLLHKMIGGLIEHTFKLAALCPERFDIYKLPKSMKDFEQ